MSEIATQAPVLDDLIGALSTGTVEVIDLTAPLSERTPLIALPVERGQPWAFQRDEISHYDARGEHVYWNNFRMSEHGGTHFDAPNHWASGRDLIDVAQVPPADLIAPVAVMDFSAQAQADPEFLLRIEHVKAWLEEHGPLQRRSWLFYRTGWDARSKDARSFLSDGRTPGVHPECARWMSEQPGLIGFGVETVGTDAGGAAEFDPPFPCHHFLHGAGKYGVTQLQNLRRLPAHGALVVAGPLPIVGGSGSPARVLALVPRSEAQHDG